MSLDIYLTAHQTCPQCGHQFGSDRDYIFEQNITHNLGGMASAAGVYEVLWHPERNSINYAAQLIGRLEQAIADMKADPPRFEAFNPKNGWGSYAVFVPWLERLLDACKRHPGATVRVSI